MTVSPIILRTISSTNSSNVTAIATAIASTIQQKNITEDQSQLLKTQSTSSSISTYLPYIIGCVVLSVLTPLVVVYIYRMKYPIKKINTIKKNNPVLGIEYNATKSILTVKNKRWIPYNDETLPQGVNPNIYKIHNGIVSRREDIATIENPMKHQFHPNMIKETV